MTKISYEKDFYAWIFIQVQNLKNHDWDKLDIENLVEEIESLGNSEKDKLESFLRIILLHMLKINFQPQKKTNSWEHSIKYATNRALRVLRKNPSLKYVLNKIVEDAYEDARLEAAIETGLNELTFPEESPWELEEILGSEIDRNRK